MLDSLLADAQHYVDIFESYQALYQNGLIQFLVSQKIPAIILAAAVAGDGAVLTTAYLAAYNLWPLWLVFPLALLDRDDHWRHALVFYRRQWGRTS